MKKTILSLIIFCLVSHLGFSQVLFNEDFDSYPAGDLNTDYTGSTFGQGGWSILRDPNNSGKALVTAESGKGNVLSIVSNSIGFSEKFRFRQDDGVIDALWNNRNTGNNICKFEYDFFGSNDYSVGCGLLSQDLPLIIVDFVTLKNRIYAFYLDVNSTKQVTLRDYDTTNPFPNDLWIKVEMFIDYNTNNMYFYIPSLNIQTAVTFTHNNIPENIFLNTFGLSSTSVAKFDNIKLSAIPTLPTYLKTDEFLAVKFNLYPNPASNVVNITNSENISVKQVQTYDLSGKLVNTQNFTNEMEIQLNVETLKSGTYLLHLQTDQGIAIKKLIKK